MIERDWGEYGATPSELRDELYKGTAEQRRKSSFFARFAGGESIFDTTLRVRDFLGMCAREHTDGRVIAVVHGEVMWATRFVLERLLPHEWQDLDKRNDQKIGNCSVLQYTRLDPHGSREMAESYSNGWVRITDPIGGRSPYGGEWRRLEGKRVLDGAELKAVFERDEPLLQPEP